MENLINSIKQSLENRNWYAALTLALTLPDIAGKIEYPSQRSSRFRYCEWFENFILDYYTSEIGPKKKKTTFLSGRDCYALRCTYLHEGNSEITGQSARETLNDFQFVAPQENSLIVIHNNRINDKLQLQVDIFCNDIINGINNWVKTNSDDIKKLERLNSFLTIYEIK